MRVDKSLLSKREDQPNARFAVRAHRSPAQGRSPPCRYARSPEVTSGPAATFDHRTYRSSSALVPECTDSPPAAEELFPRSSVDNMDTPLFTMKWLVTLAPPVNPHAIWPFGQHSCVFPYGRHSCVPLFLAGPLAL